MMAGFDALPATFTYRQAREAGVSRSKLYRLRDRGVVTQIGHGLYRRASDEPIDLDLLEIAVRATAPTLCLTTAMARHGLTDEIPAAMDVAIPAGTYAPAVSVPVIWHRFDPKTFTIGRDVIAVDASQNFGIYSPERCIIDAFRLRGQQSPELPVEALRRWLRRGGQPSVLLGMAGNFSRALTPIRKTLEVLL
jgi:hypothetical protein